ncbi:hypothetical protein ACFPIJ_12180 [Dactylosporangium cerinum]|uniref:Uncharacterized protein n=1 Tax=Dactylosporangium cerinum TaxID=1434730 RepID=A0ABV9VVD5_9ACTN
MAWRGDAAVMRDGVWRSYGSKALGFAFEAYLVFGPDVAATVFEAHPARQPDRWNDETKCEAAALVDFDHNELLFFIDAGYGYARREAILRAVQHSWESWTIRWAYKGLPDITEALGVAQPHRDPWSAGPPPQDWWSPPSLISIRDIGGVRLHTSASAQPWRRGPQLLNDPMDAPPNDIPDWMPRSGMHIDVDDRFVGVWSTAPILDLLEGFGQAWPEWRLEFWQHHYTEQVRRCDDAPALPDSAPRIHADRYAVVQSTILQWADWTVERSETTLAGRRGRRNRPPRLDPHERGMLQAGVSFERLDQACRRILGPEDPPGTELDDHYDWLRPLDVRKRPPMQWVQWATLS